MRSPPVCGFFYTRCGEAPALKSSCLLYFSAAFAIAWKSMFLMSANPNMTESLFSVTEEIPRDRASALIYATVIRFLTG